MTVPSDRLIQEIFDRYAQKVRPVQFINIGAFDGVEDEKLHYHVVQNLWRGLFVEPLDRNFDLLVENYKGYPDLKFEKAAITHHDGYETFYAPVLSEGSPEWVLQIGSLSRYHLEKLRRLTGVSIGIKEVQVPCLTLRSLMQKHDIDQVQVFKIDTEGHDWAIIAQIDFASLKPDLITYEYEHLFPIRRAETLAQLNQNGYTTYKQGRDVIAVRQELDDAIVPKPVHADNIIPDSLAHPSLPARLHLVQRYLRWVSDRTA